MAFCEEWAPTGPPLTIAALYAQGRHQFFRHEDRIYLGSLNLSEFVDG